MIPGIESKARLLAFFEAKKQKNLVLRVQDVLQLRWTDVDWLYQALWPEENGSVPLTTRKQQWQRKINSSIGCVAVPIASVIENLDFQEMERLQQILTLYRQIRIESGFPVRADGDVLVFLELSEGEQQLAEGMNV